MVHVLKAVLLPRIQYASERFRDKPNKSRIFVDFLELEKIITNILITHSAVCFSCCPPNITFKYIYMYLYSKNVVIPSQAQCGQEGG